MQSTLFEHIDISRGRHNEVSKGVWERKVKSGSHLSDRKMIYKLIDGKRCTLEHAEILGKQLHKISGRYKKLAQDGFIVFSHRAEYKGSTYSVYCKTLKEFPNE